MRPTAAGPCEVPRLLIDALIAMPYDWFMIEQIAVTCCRRANEQKIATAYRNTMFNEEGGVA
jgi:hypothetical protein